MGFGSLFIGLFLSFNALYAQAGSESPSAVASSAHKYWEPNDIAFELSALERGSQTFDPLNPSEKLIYKPGMDKLSYLAAVGIRVKSLEFQMANKRCWVTAEFVDSAGKDISPRDFPPYQISATLLDVKNADIVRKVIDEPYNLIDDLRVRCGLQAP